MAIRAISFPIRVVLLVTLVPVSLGFGVAEVRSDEPIVEHSALPPPPADAPAPVASVEQPLDTVGSDSGDAVPPGPLEMTIGDPGPARAECARRRGRRP